MKKILLIFTGGTIGSKTVGGITNVDSTAKCGLIQKYREQFGNNAEFEVIQPLETLSENLNISHWQTIYNSVCEHLCGKFCCDGIIIAHGSDTLAYSAAAMSFLLRGIRIPVVLIAANRQIGDPNSNGTANFAAAVDFIRRAGLPGVFAVYLDENGKIPVYLGTRLLQADDTDRFHAYRDLHFGEMINGEFVRNTANGNPTKAQITAKAVGFHKSAVSFRKNVLCLTPYPSLDYSCINPNPDKTAAVLHGLYHSSTACTDEGCGSLIRFADRLSQKNIPLYLLGAGHFNDESVYETANALRKCGFAVPLHGISQPAAFAKLCIAHNTHHINVQQFVKEDIFFEYLTN